MKTLPIETPGSLPPDSTVAAFKAPPQNSLRRNISWSFVGLAGYAATQWGMLIVLARLTSPEIVGQFTVSLAFTSPIMLLAGLDLRMVQAADAARRFAFPEYLGLRLIVATTAFGAITLASLVMGYPVAVAMVIVAMGLTKSIELQSDAFHGLFQQRERMDLFARSLLKRGTLSLALFTLAIWTTGSLLIGMGALAASTLIVLLCSDVPNSWQFFSSGSDHLLQTVIEPTRLGRLLVIAIPAGLRGFLISLESSLPLLFLQHYHGAGAVGAFAALAYSLVIVMTFARSFNQPAVPRLARLAHQGDMNAFYRLLGRLCGLGALVGLAGLVGVILLGRPFLTIAYGPTYADQYPVFVILMFACAVRLIGLPVAASLASLNCFSTLFLSQTFAVVVLSGLSVFLVSAYGLTGAACCITIVSLTTVTGQALVAGLWLPGILKKQSGQGTAESEPLAAAA